ncbi:MAG: hypothetical protein EA399_14695 [Desulfovibrionales bacterium]|nr:MAG: hypothetical protein EA399_14695 [Desulfovibrionales bacterium]
MLDNCNPPCLSLYQPTHRGRPESKQDRIRFKNLVKALEESLRQRFPNDEIRPLLEPYLALAAETPFWNHTFDGLAILGAKGFFRVYNLQRPVPELAVVGDSFHVKPLLRILQSADRYQILAVNRHAIRLFEGNRDALDEIEPAQGVPRTLTQALGEELTEQHQTVASYGGVGGGKPGMHHGHGSKESEVDSDARRFFRAVDQAILEHHSRSSGLPLILASLPDHHHMFHELSRNPFLVPESIDIHPDALSSIDELRKRAWRLVEPRYLERLADLVEKFDQAWTEGLGSNDPSRIAQAGLEGRIATLLIEAGRVVPGRINAATGDVEPDDLSHPQVGDVLDDLGELALKKGGLVVIVPAERMPTKTGAAAIFRY